MYVTCCMQPKDKFVMELGKPASTKPPTSDSAIATSLESNLEKTVSTPVKATSPPPAPELSIDPHVSKCTCTHAHVSTYIV